MVAVMSMNTSSMTAATLMTTLAELYESQTPTTKKGAMALAQQLKQVTETLTDKAAELSDALEQADAAAEEFGESEREAREDYHTQMVEAADAVIAALVDLGAARSG